LRAFLRERRIRLGEARDVLIVGVLDDDPNLLGRQVNGLRVLGATGDLVDTVRTHRVSGIVIAMRIDDERRGQILRLAREAGVPVDEWVMDVRRVAE